MFGARLSRKITRADVTMPLPKSIAPAAARADLSVVVDFVQHLSEVLFYQIDP